MTSRDDADVVERLLGLWSRPVPDDDAAARAAFAELYTDPVEVNGAAISPADLVVAARALQRAYPGAHRRVVDRVDTAERVVVAFELTALHLGPLVTPLGVVGATGRAVTLRVVDVLTVVDGRITAITMVADELRVLAALGVLSLRSPAPAATSMIPHRPREARS